MSQPVRPNFWPGGDSESAAVEFMREIYGIDEGWSTRSFDCRLSIVVCRVGDGERGSAARLPRQGAENLAGVFVVFIRVEDATQKLARLVHFATQRVIDARSERKLDVTLVTGSIVFLENLLGFAQITVGAIETAAVSATLHQECSLGYIRDEVIWIES